MGRRGVEPVLQHVEVEATQVLRAEQLQLGDHGVEFVRLVVRQHIGLKLGGARQQPAVDFQQIALGHGVLHGVEIAGVGQQKAQRVADAAVGVDDARHDLVVARDVARIVAGGHPQAQNLRAPFLVGFLQVDAVAERLAHLAALRIHREAVREQAAIRRAATDGAGQQKRRVEPAAVLIVALQIHVRFRPARVVLVRVRAAQHVIEGGAGVEPHFQDVVELAVVARVFVAQDFLGRHAAPGLDAALVDDVGRLVEDFHGARVQLVRFLVQEEGDGHAPGALAADDPVGPARDHVAQARLAAGRVEGRVFDGAQRGGAQRFGRLVLGEHAFAFVHAHEPLRGGAVDHRRLVAPAVRVAVRDGAGGEQAAGVIQRLDDDGHGLPDVQPAKQRKVGRVAAAALHRVQDVGVRQAVRHAGVEVFNTVGGRRVHDTRAVGVGGVVGKVDRRQALVAFVHVVQRVLEVEATQLVAHGRGDDGAFDAIALERVFHPRLGQHQQATGRIDQCVLDVRADVERLVGGDGPRGGGPDDDEGGLVELRQAERGGQFVRLGGLKRHIDCVALLVLVLDLGLGQRRSAVEAPVHRLQAPIDKPPLHQPLEQAQLARLVRLVHGLVGVVPFAQHAQALEVLHLQGDLLGGVGAALGLHLVAAQVAAVKLFDLVFDRQAVAVPAGHVMRVQALQLPGLDDHVLQDLVDRVAGVQLAIGIRWAVVQDEFFASGAR